MDIDIKFLHSLLYEEEGNSLDFKRDQYRFCNSSDFEKSELLKDIIAFANGWRRSDAFIVVGVKEKKGEKNEVVGINELLDDADLQQFVNSKTQRPIEFIYINHKVEDKYIGIFKIPIQNRPFYLTKNFGKLKKNVVYIRRGTSTDEATPDEILTMRDKTDAINIAAPVLSLSLLNEGSDPVDVLEVEPYEALRQEEVIENLKKLVLSDEILKKVDFYSKKLDQIQDRYPDGNAFYPYKAEIIYKFNKKLSSNIFLAENDFKLYCKLTNLFNRSFELNDTQKMNVRKHRGLKPLYALLQIDNTGTAPVEEPIIYLKDSDSVAFYSWKELLEIDIDPNFEYPRDVKNILNKIKEYDNGIDKPVPTMYERVTGRPWTLFDKPLADMSHLFSYGKKIYMSSRNKDRAKISIHRNILHNHNLIFYAENIFLCPMVAENESGEFSYEIHAQNLPKPITGTCKIIGKTRT